MKLPNAERAVIDIRKLRDYSLSPTHPEGKHKARVFLEKLGLTANDAERLRELIVEAILKSEAKEQEPSSYGQRFVVDFQVQWEQQLVVTLVTVRTAWIVRDGEDFPRLTSCYIPRRSF
jgi:hypothetical protein